MKSALYTDLSRKPRLEWHPVINPRHPINSKLKRRWLFNENRRLVVKDLLIGDLGTIQCDTPTVSTTDGWEIRSWDNCLWLENTSNEYGGPGLVRLPDVTFAGDFSIGMLLRCYKDGNVPQYNFGSDNNPSTPRNLLYVAIWNNTGSKPRWGMIVGGTGGGVDFTSTWADYLRASVVVIRSGSTATCYFNGIQQGTKTVGTGSVTFTHVLINGKWDGSEKEFGWTQIYDLAYWDRALTYPDVLYYRDTPYGTYDKPALLVAPFRHASQLTAPSATTDFWPFLSRFMG